MEHLTNEEEDMIFETKPKLFSIGTSTISNEIVLLLNVGVSKIKINGNLNHKGYHIKEKQK
jgi:hypothetical protein